ncbi:hypothetical protein HKCCE3408_17155 [Rhodobacterales bacterium HKCCE3408]|nr:hypothetical protein [Rhodobacterales bacterium HKCCE3408]
MGKPHLISGQAAAATYLARVNAEIIKAAGQRRQGHLGQGEGARPPSSIAGAAVKLVVIDEIGLDRKRARVTPLGFKTGRRTLPRILEALDPADPRRRAAILLADTAERLGSVKGVDLAGTVTKSEPSDGGATTKVKHVERMRRMEALANGWPLRAAPGQPKPRPRLAVKVRRQTGPLQEIRLFPAMVAICCHGQSCETVLRSHGWVPHTLTRRRLVEAVLAGLDDVAEGMGLGRWNKRPLDRDATSAR